MVINIMLWNLKTLDNDLEIIKLIKSKYYDFFDIDGVRDKDELYESLKKILGN